MILFISKYPETEEANEGMNVRIAAIDNLVQDKERVYLDIQFNFKLLPQIKKINSNVTIIKANAVFNILTITSLAAKADIIYVHSVYNALRVLLLYLYCDSIITDLHGLVSEEESMRGRYVRSYVYTIIESLVLSKSSHIIAVSKAMKKYYERRYKKIISNIITLPIFHQDEKPFCDKDYFNKLNVVYSGGAQAWQNISKMIAAIKTNISNFNFFIFSAEPDSFEALLNNNDLTNSVFLSKLSQKDLVEYYNKMHFGFLLRDDIPINRVACPTKLIEYLNYGIIPVVLQPQIGDFNDMHYSCILYDDFCAGRIPSDDKLKRMIKNNYELIKRMKTEVSKSTAQLISIFAKGYHV